MQQLGREREQMRLSFGQWKTGTANNVVINWVDMALQSFENHRGCNGIKTINTMWVSPPASSSRPVPSQCVTTIVTGDIETQRPPGLYSLLIDQLCKYDSLLLLLLLLSAGQSHNPRSAHNSRHGWLNGISKTRRGNALKAIPVIKSKSPAQLTGLSPSHSPLWLRCLAALNLTPRTVPAPGSTWPSSCRTTFSSPWRRQCASAGNALMALRSVRGHWPAASREMW